MAMIPCPECDALNKKPTPDTKKVTCSNCGMIIIVAKVEAAAEAEDSKPVIKRRTTRNKPAVESSERPTRGSGGGRRRSTGGSSRRRTTSLGKNKEEVAEEEGGRRYTRSSKKDGPPMAMVISSIAAIVVIAIAAFFVLGGDDGENADDPNKNAAKTDQQAADSDETTDFDPDAGVGDVEDPSTVEDTGEKPAAVTSTKKPAKKKGEPKKYASNWVPTPYEPTAGTTEAEVEELKKHIEVLKDLNATRTLGIAQTKIGEKPKKAIPLLINALMDLNKGEKDDCARGWQIIQTLQMVTAQKIEDGYYDDAFHPMDFTDPTTKKGEGLLRDRKKAVNLWCKWWDTNGASWKPPAEGDG